MFAVVILGHRVYGAKYKLKHRYQPSLPPRQRVTLGTPPKTTMPIIDGISCFVHTSEGPLKEFPCVDGPSPIGRAVHRLISLLRMGKSSQSNVELYQLTSTCQ